MIAQQATGHDFEHTVAGKVIVVIHVEHGNRLIRRVVEFDRLDSPHHHTGAFDRRLGFESPDVLEYGADFIPFARRDGEQIAGLQRKKQQRNGSRQHKQPYPDIRL